MDKQVLSFENFLFNVSPQYQPFVQKVHDELLGQGYKLKLEMAKSGYLVSYGHPKTKRSILNFVFRKSGLVIRVYADHLSRYSDFLGMLPDGMMKIIAKSPLCKRLIDPMACNQRCPMGYAFEVGGEWYKKCRYNCFLLPVNDESVSFLETFIAHEMKERMAG